MNNFKCPHCNTNLNVNNHLVLTAEKPNGEKGIILMNPVLGNYNASHHPDFKPAEGEAHTFLCPACNTTLTSDKSDKLAHIQMEDEEGNVFDIFFSRIKGEESTYRIIGETVETFGEDKQKYVNFFNLSQLT